jgi:predicted small lipoprotein YifL
MKKIICMLLVLTVVAAMAACGSTPSNGPATTDPSAGASQPEQSAPADPGVSDETTDTLYYDANGVIIHVYDLAEDTLASLGEPMNTFESASCAYQGMDYFYYYDGFELTVNEVDGAKRITVIKIADDTVSNPQGLKIGSTEEELKQLMGDGYTESAGLYTFAEGFTALQVQVKEGKVASIVYIYTP